MAAPRWPSPASPASPCLALAAAARAAPADQRTQLPTFVEGDRVTGRTDFETIVEGSAELRAATP
jgi:hypothetical protein